MEAWINGEFKGWDQANVSILSHSFGRGSAIFEVLDVVPAEKGPAFFGLQEHVDRFLRSAELVYMDLPMGRDEIMAACIKAAAKNEISHGATKMFAYYPGIEFDILPQNPEVHLAIFCVDFAAFGIKQDNLSAPTDAGISTYKKLHPETMPLHAKVCGSYVNGCLATAEVRKKGYGDVINVDTNGYVAESAAASVFFVKDGVIQTARTENVLKGITRMAIFELADNLGQPVEERDIHPDELASMDEAFFAVSLKHVQPIRSIDGHTLGNSCPGPITQRITEGMKSIYNGTDHQFESWLTYIR